jgi:amino acid permease
MAVVVGTIIGSGIFLVPSEMMRDVGSSSLVYLAWVVGGLLPLFEAMTYAELGAMLPAIFIVSAAAVLVSSYLDNLKGSLLGTALILLGLPVLFLVRRMNPESTS